MSKYSNRVIDGQVCKWIQDIGWVNALLATEIEIGDCLIYNCGYTYQVVSIVKETAKTIVFEVESKKGKLYQQRIKKTTYWPTIKKEN